MSRPFYIARFLMEIGDLAIILPICRCTCKGTFTIYQPIPRIYALSGGISSNEKRGRLHILLLIIRNF